MVFEWLCPYCKRKFYSANEEKEKECVTCIYCDEDVVNPYFEGTSDSKNGPLEQKKL